MLDGIKKQSREMESHIAVLYCTECWTQSADFEIVEIGEISLWRRPLINSSIKKETCFNLPYILKLIFLLVNTWIYLSAGILWKYIMGESINPFTFSSSQQMQLKNKEGQFRLGVDVHLEVSEQVMVNIIICVCKGTIVVYFNQGLGACTPNVFLALFMTKS